MKRFIARLLAVVIALGALAAIGGSTATPASADPPGSCYPLGYESHQWDLKFGIGTTIVHSEDLSWNDDCYNVDINCHCVHESLNQFKFCSETGRVEQYIAFGGQPYWMHRVDSVLKYEYHPTGGPDYPCSDTAHQWRITIAYSVQAADGGAWGQCEKYGTSAETCTSGSGPV